MKRLRQRLISGITALSIFASSLFPAVTVFSEEYAAGEGAVTGASESVTDSAQTGTGTTSSDEAFYLPADAGINEEETAADTGEIASDGTDAFSCKNGNTDISVSVRDGVYTVADGTEIPVDNVAFTAYEVNIDDQGYPIDVDRRVNVVRAYNTAWTWESVRIIPASGTARFTYNFTEDVPAEYADSVTVYGVQFGEWTAVDMEYPVVEGGLVKSVSFEAALPDLGMFALVWTDPAGVKPDEAIASSDRLFDFANGNITAQATAFTGAIFTADEGNEYGAVPVNANTAVFTADELAPGDERTAPFATQGDETVRVYAPKFSSEKYADVSVSDFSVQVTYALTAPVPEDKGYSCMAFAAADGGISMIPSEKVIENGYIKAITFTANDVFAVYENIELKTLTASAEDEYTITLKYDKGAGIPDGAELIAVPMETDDYMEDMAQALGWTDEDKVLYTRLFDITIEKDGEEFEPLTPVTVTAQLHDVEEVPEAMQVVHIDDEGATEVEIGASEGEQYTFETESFSVYGFGSALHTVMEESTDIADIAVYTLSADVDVTAQDTQLDTPVEGVVIDRAYSLAGDSTAKLWIKAEVSENAELGDRESVSLYGVDNGTATREILADITENEGLFAAPAGVTAIAVARDTGLRRRTAEARPDGEESGKIVSLSGMMPINAQASASDVTGTYMQAYEQYGLDEMPLAAYDISILENTSDNVDDSAVRTKYQPGEGNPIRVEITDPRIIDEDILLYHITADGTTEEVTVLEVSEGKICFDALGFSVYEVVKLADNETEYEIAEISDEVSVTDFTANTVSYADEFVFDVVEPQIDDVSGSAVMISSKSDFESYLSSGKNGFYISSAVKSSFIGDSIVEKLGDTNKRTGLNPVSVTDKNNKGVTDASLDYASFVGNAVNLRAVRYFFEPDATDNTKYYAYCYKNDDTAGIKHYVYNHKETGSYNSLSLTTEKSQAMKYTIEDYNNAIVLRNAENGMTTWRWNFKNNTAPTGFGSWKEAANDNKLYFWYYTPPAAITSDPCHLDYATCGEKTYGLVSSSTALMAQYPNGSATTLGALSLTAETNTDGNQCFTSQYGGITGWKFHWITGTATHKISAVADDGAAEKYLQLTSSGLALVDSYEDGSVFTISAGTAGTIKLTAADGSINRKDANTFQKGAASVFYLVDLSAADTDVLGIGGSFFGLVNAFDANQGNALMCEYKAEEANKLANQAVWRTGDNFSFEGGITEWTFEHIDFNRYTLSAVDKSGNVKYLKLQNAVITLSDEPYVLTLENGTGDYDGKIRIINTVNKGNIYNDRNNHRFSAQNNITNIEKTRWFTLVDVPEAPASDPLGLDGKTYGIINPVVDKGAVTGGQAMTAASSLPLKYVKYDSERNTYKLTNEFISGWTFHWTDHNNYILSAETDDGVKYLKFTNAGVSLVDEIDATPVCIETGTGDYAGRIRIMPLLDGYLSALYRDGNFKRQAADSQNNYNKLFGNQAWHDLVEIPVNADPYSLDGKTYGLMNFTGGTHGYALMDRGNDGESTNVDALVELVTRKTNGEKTTYYVDERSQITRWTFNNVAEDRYTLVSDTGKYLAVSGDSLIFAENTDEASEFRVVPAGNNRIELVCGGKYITFSSETTSEETSSTVNSFGISSAGSANTKLYLMDFAQLTEEDLVTYSADRISISDAVDGQRVIVYTRVWDDENKRYNMYAIDGDGSMYPVYASGGKILWLGDGSGSLEWEFTVYTDDAGNETHYYELYNPYADMYLAPQLIEPQVVSEDKIGLTMPGRRTGDFYSHILAWDQAKYAYIGLRPETVDDTDPEDESASELRMFEPCSQNASMHFYFASIEELNLTGALHTVETVDNNDFGIKMRMVDYEQDYKNNAQSEILTNQYGGVNDRGKKGILSTNIGDDGYPTVAINNNVSLGQLFSDYSDESKITEANHLFIKSIYESSGYFEFDSCQNFATFYGLDENGNIVKNPSNADGTTDFTVYRELGTSDKEKKPTLQHGQFLPYDIIKPNVYATVNNPLNLYTALASTTDYTVGQLSPADPRKYENLYAVCDSEGKSTTPNYSNGMELTAQFVQTVDGLDAWDHDIIFEFTGDDDFWLYVDGELVIDLGGNHSALAGNVNFRTGVVYVDGTTTDLRSIFKNNYKTRNPAASEEEINAYLDERFAEGKNIFKDYSTHTMHVYYMERGGGASNLHMRFNLSSVTPGNVVVTKNISGEGADLIDKDFVEYPFQIRYKQRIPKTDPDTGEDILDENGEVVFDEYTEYLDNSDPNIGVKYQGSELDADFAALYNPPGSSVTYNNVFFINPTKNTEISFPENTIEYELIECAVSSVVYPEIRINNELVTATYDENDPTKPSVKEEDGLRSYHSGFVSAEERPTIIFDNKVEDDMVSTLKFKKILKDKNGNTLEYVPEYRVQEKLDELKASYPTLSDPELKALYDSKYDSATFDFRLFISPVKVPESQIDYAHLYRYYIVDNDGYICKRDTAHDVFTATTTKYSDTLNKDTNSLSDSDFRTKYGFSADDVVFVTSDYGKISEIPPGFWVYVPGLLPASVFKVVEETTEGYGLDPDNPYKMVMGYRKNSTESETQHLASYMLYEGTQNQNIGQVEPAIDPVMEVTNKRGYGLTINKVWSDREITKGHDTVYTAVYIGDTMLSGTLRQMVFPVKSAYYFWGDLESGREFGDYTVREVKVTGDPVFNGSGVCTNESSLMIAPVAPGGEINLGCVSKTDESETYKYIVTYDQGASDSSSRVDTITNTREGGLKIRLFEWNSTDPLANGVFKLYKEVNGTYVEQNEYTSDAEGTVTVLYNLDNSVKYKIVQTAAPSGYVGLDSDKEIVFVKNDKTVNLYKSDGVTEWSDTAWANQKAGSDGLDAFIDIYNKPFEFVIAKYDNGDKAALEGVHFAVYKQTNATINGYEKSKFKLKGFEDIKTDAHGVAVVCNKSNPLTVGKVYFIEEIQHLDGYDGLPADIVFRLDELGKPTLMNTDENGMDAIGGTLTEEGNRYVYTLSVPNVRKNADANLTITKTVEGSFGSRTKEFTFTLTVEGAATDDIYEWTMNGETQATPLKSGGTFTLGHDDTAVITVPLNKAITVTENAEGYQQEYVLTGEYTLPDEEDKEKFTLQGDARLAVTNTYDGVVPTGADLPDVSVVFAGFLALGAVLLAGRQKLLAVNDTDSSDEDV